MKAGLLQEMLPNFPGKIFPVRTRHARTHSVHKPQMRLLGLMMLYLALEDIIQLPKQRMEREGGLEALHMHVIEGWRGWGWGGAGEEALISMYEFKPHIQETTAVR